ncbi:MAG TPA: GspH/FimT family pseudopilin [Longimicrobium sp.]|nr:GspH/FimT family pseudopilin [Longimicrobium sp.]
MHTPARHPSRGRGGFSLAEMLIVLVIFGIAAAMIVPRLRGVVRVSSIQGALNRVANDISYTRIRAIRTGSRAQLVVGATGKTYTVTTDPYGTARKVEKTVNLALDYTDLVLSPANDTITFDSRGMLLSTSSSKVKATRQGQTDSLTISGVGRVYREY